MYGRLASVALAVAIALSVLVTAWAKDAPGAKTMAERTVPVPAGVSAELQKMIAGRPVPPPTPVPGSQEEWLKAQQALDALQAKEVPGLAKAHGATFERKEVAGVPCFVVSPREVSDRYKDRVLVHLHGGAFVLGGGEGAVREAMWVAAACKARVISVDYRRPPLHPFPAAIEDAVAVWKHVIKTQDAAATALFGASAGGNLTLATTHRLKQLGLPLPGALLAGTPMVDMEKNGDSWYTLQGLDPLGSYDGFVRACLEVYMPSKDFANPLVSPIRGDLKGFPPTILMSGTRDLLLSDTVRMHRALRKAGVEADLHIYEGQSHGDYMQIPLPESKDAQQEVSRFFDGHLK